MEKKFVIINLREFGKIIMSSSLWVNKITYSSVSGVVLRTLKLYIIPKKEMCINN